MNNNLVKDNFYEAVNGEWLKKAKIPGDQPAVSAFLELHLGIEKTLISLTKEWEKNQEGLSDNLQKFVKLYKMTKDFDTRNTLGAKPFEEVESRISNLQNLESFQQEYYELALDSYSLPFEFSVNQDFLNSNNQVLYFEATNLFLPDTTYYKDEEKKAQLIGLFTQTTSNLLHLYGYDEETINNLLSDALAFDELLVPVTKSSVEKADYVKLYNPMKRDEVNSYTNTFSIMNAADQLVKSNVEQLIVTNPDFIHSFDEIINEDNFKLIKSWMIVSNAIRFASDLSDDLRVASGAFRRALSGIKDAQDKDKFAFYQAYNRFSQVVGLYYGEEYFGKTAKEDVKTMVHEMISVYKERIEQNTWLNQNTKDLAIKKLSTLSVHVGYPDELPNYYDLFEISSYDEGSNLLLERIKMDRIITEDNFKKYNQTPNRNIWGMPASMVNAYYNPTNNQIVFPAAILQEPYYSLNQTTSENYGGIGAVMAHEISHAFDNNGAKFDETGSLKNWWTEKDLEAFNQKAKDMITLFDGAETGYGECNGTLTVSENIADSGGLRCALEASKKNPNHNLDEFFQNWARVWRNKASTEYSQLLLQVDVHGPAILRANMQLSNLPEFIDYYEIKEDDKMYLDPKKQVSIW
jgi:putative endopeptidase